MEQKKKLYVVSMKHYGSDGYCGCHFEVVKAFTSLDDAKEFIKKDEEYDYDEVMLDNRKGQ